MKYFLHDTNSFNDEKITELYLAFGYEGLGLFYTILEKLAAQEKPIKTKVLKAQLKVGKRLEKCWSFMEEIGILLKNNDYSHAPYLEICRKSERLSIINPGQWISLKYTVFERDNYTCSYCSTIEGPFECDHIIPFSKGGSDNLNNLTTACRRCNRQKKDKSVEEFIIWKGEQYA